MGYLDELKSEAEKARKLQQEAERAEANRENVYRQLLRPVMLDALVYLRELVTNLNDLPEQVKTWFEFPAIGRIEALRQSGYRLLLDSTDQPTRISLHFEARAAKESRHAAPSKESEELCDFLRLQRISSMRKPLHKDSRDAYLVEAQLGVQIQVELRADMDAGRIAVETINFHKPGSEILLFDPETAGTDAWRDRIGGYVLGKVESLLGPPREMSQAERERLERFKEMMQEKQRAAEEPTEQRPRSGVMGLFSKLLGK